MLQINIFKKNLDFEAYHLQLQEIHVTITILEWLVSLTETPEEKNLKLSDLNQIYGLLATLSVPQHFGFFWIPAAKAPYCKIGWAPKAQTVIRRPK